MTISGDLVTKKEEASELLSHHGETNWATALRRIKFELENTHIDII